MGTTISWTDETWNPTTGCSRISEGCRHCYAERMSLRFGWSKKPWTAANAPVNVIEHESRLDKPRKFKPGTRVFVNSMSDLFHAGHGQRGIDRARAGDVGGRNSNDTTRPVKFMLNLEKHQEHVAASLEFSLDRK